MSFLSYFYKCCPFPAMAIPKGNKKRYNEYFDFWCNYLLERCVNIFKWEKLPFKQKFLELYLLTIGWCGLVKLPNSHNVFDAVMCALDGITNYPTEFNNATATTPLTNVMFHVHGTPPSIADIELEGIIADNNQTRTPLLPLIEYYANILAHIDLTIQKVCIKMRSNALIKASDSNKVQAITDWYKSIEKGDSVGVLDEDTFMSISSEGGIVTAPLGSVNNSELSELLNARTKYINSFFGDIGMNTVEEKRERLISSEVDIGFNRVLFNISDMLESRKQIVKQIKEVYNYDTTVELNTKLAQEFVSTQLVNGGENNEESTK